MTTTTTYDRLLIGSEWVEPSTTDIIEVRSPHDQRLIGHTPKAAAADVDRAVASARRAFDEGPWPRMSPGERREVITRFNALHAARAQEIAELITAENGSPITFTGWSQTSIPQRTRDWLDVSERYPWEQILADADGSRTLVVAEPVGVVAAVIPWNSPHSAAITKMIPALLAGCTVILKSSPETAIDSLLLGELFVEAGVPDGVVSILPADRDVSEYLVSHPDVDKIAFTGSTAAARAIGSTAAQQLKRVTLELGGKSAAIVLDDADVDTVVAATKRFSLSNNGEACVAHTRILVHRSIYSSVVRGLAEMIDGLVVGDPGRASTDIGPLVREGQYRRVLDYIGIGIDEGARVVAGGLAPIDDPALAGGFYVRPTLFADATNSMRIAREEIFGPVLVVIPFDTDDEAVRIANDSEFGLSGGVWSADRERALRVARAIRTGLVHVNGAPRHGDSPFGGFKSSGIGREYGPAGLGAFTELKSIAIGAPVAASR